MVRSFVAIEISQNIKRNLGKIISKLSGTNAEVKWVRPANMHITLKFLGSIDECDVPEICNMLKDAAVDVEPFDLEIGGLGAFPDIKKPKVVFVNIVDQSKALLTLYERVEERLADFGIKRESRRFTPHLTIGRVRPQKNLKTLIDLIDNNKKVFAGGLLVESIDLMMSELLPEGPEHSKLGTIDL